MGKRVISITWIMLCFCRATREKYGHCGWNPFYVWPENWKDFCIFQRWTISLRSTFLMSWLQEYRLIDSLPRQPFRHLYIDNYSSHNLTEDRARQQKKFGQIFDTFHRTRLNYPNHYVSHSKDWKRKTRGESVGMSTRFGLSMAMPITKVVGCQTLESRFLRLVAHVVRDVNGMRDKDGITYLKKAMIFCGMALKVNGNWEESQLKPELQNINRKHRKVFENPEEE